MKNRIYSWLGAVMIVAFFAVSAPSAAFAAALQADHVSGFISSMEDIKSFAERLQEEGKEHIFETDMSGADRFTPYMNGVHLLQQESEGDYQDLGDIVQSHGFSSQEEWATVGDRVMLAFVALKTEETQPNYAEMAEQITPEMLAQMPEQAREQIEHSLLLIERVQEAPAGDKTAVRPFVPEIENWLDIEE